MRRILLFSELTLFALLFFCLPCFAGQDRSKKPFEILPWRAGQYAVYQITTFEGEGAGNKYRFCVLKEERVNGKAYFWLQADIWEQVTFYGFNAIHTELKKNLSMRYLVAPVTTEAFFEDPGRVILSGVFPKDCLKLSIQIEDGPWHEIEPGRLFDSGQVIADTPYAATPHARGRIDFRKLKVGRTQEKIDSPAGSLPCYRFSVLTGPQEDYCDEGFELWRSPQVPILGIVRFEFSITHYWEKRLWKMKQKNKTLPDVFKSFYARGVDGRRRPDTCVMTLIEYGQK